MAATPGICTKTATCQTARAARIIAIPLGEGFACPECGSALSPPTQATQAPPAAVAARVPFAMPMVLAGAGLFVLGGALFVGHEIGQGAPPGPMLIAAAPRPMVPSAAVVTPQAAPAPAPAMAPKLAPVALASTSPVPQAAVAPPALPTPSAAPQPIPVMASAAAATLVPAPAAPAAPAAAAPVPAAAMPDKSPAPVVRLTAAPTPATAPPKPLPPPSAPVAVAAIAKPVAAPEPALPPDAPFSPTPEAGGAPAYPAELAADGKIGRVPVTCQIQTDGTPAACRAGARSSGPAFSAAALAWLSHGHVRFHPIILHGRPAAATHSWIVSIEESPVALADARRKQHEAAALAAAAEPAPPPPELAPPKVQQVIARQTLPEAPVRNGVNRPFSTHVVAGGAPVFPAYYDEGRPGAVTVTCMISASGQPSDCHTGRVLGGSGFGKAVLAWLGSGGVRFRPMLADGQPVGREETWTVVFNEMPTAAYPE